MFGRFTSLLTVASLVCWGIVSHVSAQIPSLSPDIMALYGYQMDGRTSLPLGTNENISIYNVYDAPVDGCYFGLSNPKNTYDPMEIDCEACLEAGGRLKINGSYVWGLTSTSDKIYWGTTNNLLCLAFAIVGEAATTAYETSDWTCDCPEGSSNEALPPRVYVYEPNSGVVKDLTPDDEAVKGTACTGLRSAGTLNDVVFLGGPDTKHGLTVYAYSTKDDTFLGLSHFENVSNIEGFQVTNIRKWLVIDGVLYCGVRYVHGEKSGGAILRWRGNAENPFQFEVVGYTAAEAAELAFHDGRIYVGGWPAMIFRSPELPEGGLTADHAATWETVWSMSDYEIDPFVLRLTGIGGFKSYKGRLYWGFLHIPWAYLSVLPAYYGLTSQEDILAAVLGAWRSSALFSASDFSSKDDVVMLYGEEKLPQFDRAKKKWEIKPNASGYKPKWGRSGAGNLFLNYIWSMEVYNDKLYIGTMDMSDLIEPALNSSEFSLGGMNSSLVLNMLKVDKKQYGYDCLVIDDPEKEPSLVTNDGFGNPAAYGIRNMLVHDGQLYIGTANPLNLHEQGGWSLLTLTERSAPTASAKQPEVADLLYRQTDSYVEISSLKGESIESVTLVDMAGRILRKEKGDSPTAVLVTDGLPGGVYVVMVQTNAVTKSFKIKVR